MVLHPEARALMEHYAQLGARRLDDLGVIETRQAVLGARRFSGEPENVASVRDATLPGPTGRLPVRVYDPEPGGGLPVIVYFHGGGWVAGSIVTADRSCRALARSTHCVVASIEYRLSPETQFPGPLDDAYAAVCAIAGGAVIEGADLSRVVVGGDSAGGGLAAGVALLLRDRAGPQLAAQILFYPALGPAPGGRSSCPDDGAGYGLTRGEMDFFWAQYLSDPAAPDPYAAPLCAANVEQLPPALVVTAEHDILRDEGIAYAERLRRAGVNVRTVDAPGMVHGFLGQFGAVPAGRQYLDDVARFLREQLGC